MRTLHAFWLAFLTGLALVGTEAADLTSDLVGRWRFEVSNGGVAKDTSGTGHDGVVEGAETRAEKGGTSLELDGLGSQVVIQAPDGFGLIDALTASVWVKPAELRNSTVIFGVPHTNETWTTPVFGMYAHEDHVVTGMWEKKGKVLVESAAEIPVRQWSFLATVYDGKMLRLYVNGELSGDAPHAGPIISNGQPLIIGRGLGGKPSLRGRVADLRLYRRAFSPAEIRELYRTTSTGYDLGGPAQAVSRWKDGTAMVENHGNSPESQQPWRARPTRLFELLDGYQPTGDRVQVDRYGGWTDRPKEKATGFFYVKKLGDRYWLIDPEGYRFYHVAVNAVAMRKGMETKYGSADGWPEGVTIELRGLGFNGLGNWSNERLAKVKEPLVWVLRKDFAFAFAREKKLVQAASGTTGFTNRCMPVFHPEFEAFCEQYGKDLAVTANDRCLLGIMTDNELQCPVDLLDRYLALEVRNPDLEPGHDAAAAWLAERQGKTGSKSITQRDRYEFIAYAFERYYRIVTRVVRKYDPNHMYLGSRLNYHTGEWDNPWLWKMLSRYHDVVSVNYYAEWGPQTAQFAQWAEWSDKPILLTEWYAKAMDVPGLSNTKGAGWLVRTQEDRGRFYQHFALNALELKNIVGWHWFKYCDDPSESVALDSAGGANKGMFNLKGEPYRPLSERAKAVNREVYPLIEFFDSRR